MSIEKYIKNQFYNEKLEQFGGTAEGLGYKNRVAQINRFGQLVKILPNDVSGLSIADFGCGFGDLYSYIKHNFNGEFQYIGYDTNENNVEKALELLKEFKDVEIEYVRNLDKLKNADFYFESGVFNVKHEFSNEEWQTYILMCLDRINQLSTKGFAFNLLTSYSDKEKMESGLYYGDPCFFFDYCKRKYARNVALLHDYNEYDFTILVRK